MGIKSNLAMTVQGFRSIKKCVNAVKNGQATNYAIFQTAHRLEKGLCISEPRKYWGFDSAIKLVHLIAEEKGKQTKDEKAIEIGQAVLSAYVNEKEQKNETDMLTTLKAEIKKADISLTRDCSVGGAVNLRRSDLLVDSGSIEQLFMTRHSVRDFDSSPIDNNKLEKAIRLALRAPSACNRQASMIYVISGEERVKIGSSNEYHADKYLIITGDMKAFALSELNDWIVSTSVFCGYLSLALHAEGIGSCIFRKDIISKSEYNDNIRKLCNIPENEQIILEMAIGNYKQSFNAPVSYRREPCEIVHYIN